MLSWKKINSSERGKKATFLKLRLQKSYVWMYHVSCYNRREKGQIKISMQEWNKLADILNVPIDEIYEPDDNQVFICNDNATVHYLNQGTNNIYSVPELLLETQRKYIEMLEKEIRELKQKNK